MALYALVIVGAASDVPVLVMIGGGLALIYMLGTFIPSLAVAVRRLHDTNKSGWMYLIGLIPVVGVIILIVFLATEGTHGENQYGSDPKGYQDDPHIL